MIQSKQTEILVGLFVAAGLAALFMLAMKVSNLGDFTDEKGYQVTANFQNIGGLKPRSPVPKRSRLSPHYRHLRWKRTRRPLLTREWMRI